MPLTAWLSKPLAGFRGAWTRLLDIEARPERAGVAKNVRFAPGKVSSREGFPSRLAVSGRIGSIHQWITSTLNRVILLQDTTAVLIDISNNSSLALFTQAGAKGLSVAEAGDKAFIASYTAAQLSAGKVRISLPLISGGQIDTAFPPPWANVPTITDTGAGEVTQGVHLFGYVVESRTGFTGKPGPAPGGVFAPVSFTVAAGGRALSMGFIVNTPPDTAFVQPIMTRSDNHDRWYFLPNGAVAVPGGATGWSISIPINISDERLADGAEEANGQFDMLTDNSGGGSPAAFSSVFSYGKRMAYVADNKVYFSDPDDYQAVTEAGHVVQVPGQKRIVTGFALRMSCYLLGPGWTYEVADNGDLPSTWAYPTEVSGAIGTTSIQGVEWRTAGDYAWVASTAGLYLFSGQYATRPVSYYQTPEWERINWAAPYAVQIRDDYVRQRVYVAAALDANTEASHLLVWDYARGMTPEDVDFSLDNFASGTFASLGLVQTHDTLETEVWIGPRAAGNILHSVDGVHADNGTLAIGAIYETGLALTNADESKRINRFGGIAYAVSGSGVMHVSFFGLDHLRQVTVDSELAIAPGWTYERQFHRIEENMSIQFATYNANEWFELTGLTFYWRPFATNYLRN